MNQLVEQLPCNMELPVGDTIFMASLFYEEERETLLDTMKRLIKEEGSCISNE